MSQEPINGCRSRSSAPVIEFRFGRYSVRSDDLILRFGTTALPLAPKVVKTLLVLMENAGRFVSKDQLLQSVWNGESVEESNLSQNVYVLRRQFESTSGQTFIETLPKRGYKFSHRVTKRVLGSAKIHNSRSRLWTAAGIIALLVIGAWLFVGRSEKAKVPRGDALIGRAEQADALGWYYWRGNTESDLRESIREFRLVVADDPRSAAGYAGEAIASAKLADVWEGSPSAQVEAVNAERLSRQAIALKNASGVAHAARGFVEYDTDGDFAAAASDLRQAIALEPDLAVAHSWYGAVLLWQGDLVTARHELERASTLDATLPNLAYLLALDSYMSRDYPVAIAYAKIVQPDSLFVEPAELLLAAAHEQTHQYPAAIRDIERMRSASSDLGARGELAHIYASMGDTAKARSELKVVERLAHAGQSRPLITALAYSANNRLDEAFAWLFQMPMVDRRLFSHDPRLDVLRGDHRFARWMHG